MCSYYQRILYWFIGLIVISSVYTPINSSATTLPEGRNLLLGKKASFSLKPNYRLTMGGDESDLSDGELDKNGKKSLWTDKGTVGWSFKRKPGVLIMYDLGGVYPIAAFGFNSATGASGVTFPTAVFVYVSEDRESWHYVTNLINETIPQDRYGVHHFVARDLKVRGQYIALYVVKGGYYGFVDEIEVIRGNHDPSKVDLHHPAVNRSELERDALARAKDTIQTNITSYFIKAARDQLSSVSGEDNTAVLGELEKLEWLNHINGSTVVGKLDYSKGLPYTELDEKVCMAMGKYFSRHYYNTITVWQPSDSIWSHTTNPFARPKKVTVPKLHADMMIGEYEPVAFNVSNNTAKPITVNVEVSDLQGVEGKSVWPNSQIERHITTHVVGSGFLFYDDALPLIDNGDVIIPPGMTRQVWLILQSNGMEPQNYTGVVSVTAGETSFELPMSVSVYPVEMPTNPTYISQSWSYFTSPPARGYERQSASELKRNYENAHVLHHAYIPWPKVDRATKMLKRPIELDFTKLDEMLDYRPYVKLWLLWPGFEWGPNRRLNYYHAIDMPQVGTAEHELLFKEWVRQVRDHMHARGFPTQKWAFYWVDEPGDEQFKKYVVPASKLAKEVDPTILIWENHQVTLGMLKKYPGAIDIHSCPFQYYRSHPEILKYIFLKKQRAMQYQTGSSKRQDPHRYYRLRHMESFALGLDGGGEWVWGDAGGQFSDYEGPYPSYGMVYATKTGPITSKRREAWREGIEDVELWRHLQSIAEKTGNVKLDQLAIQSPDLLVRSKSKHSSTPNELMEVRLEILKALGQVINSNRQ